VSEGLPLAATLERVQRAIEVPIDAAAAEPRLYLEISAAIQRTERRAVASAGCA